MNMECNILLLVDLLKDRKHASCTEIGESLFADKHRFPKDRQCYARPAGKLVAEAKRRGLVKRAYNLVLGYGEEMQSAPRYCLVNEPPHERWGINATRLDAVARAQGLSRAAYLRRKIQEVDHEN
jgi:hypothetical protein